MQLEADNLLAWELYHQARLEGVGHLILELQGLEVTEFEADELAYKLDVIGSTYAEIQVDEMKRAREEAEMKRRMAGR